MDIDRLSRFGTAVKDRASRIWTVGMAHLARGRRWLRRGRRWLTRRLRLIALAIVGCLLLYLGWLYGQRGWSAYASEPELYTPFFTPIGALLVGLAAFGQWRVARLRHEE
jgi:hypothetical protein